MAEPHLCNPTSDLLSPNERSRDHVVQPLLPLGETNHDEADAQNHPRKNLREVPSRGSRERNAVAIRDS